MTVDISALVLRGRKSLQILYQIYILYNAHQIIIYMDFVYEGYIRSPNGEIVSISYDFSFYYIFVSVCVCLVHPTVTVHRKEKQY